jgi:hypothetical protein
MNLVVFPPCCNRCSKAVLQGEMSIKMQVPQFQQKSSRITISFYDTIPVFKTHTQAHTAFPSAQMCREKCWKRVLELSGMVITDHFSTLSFRTLVTNLRPSLDDVSMQSYWCLEEPTTSPRLPPEW